MIDPLLVKRLFSQKNFSIIILDLMYTISKDYIIVLLKYGECCLVMT